MLAPSGGCLILYQAYGNLYAMTGRKAYLLEDKQILRVGVFDKVFSTWMDFGGNTRDLGSFGEETDKITDLQHGSRISLHAGGRASQMHRDAVIMMIRRLFDVLKQYQKEVNEIRAERKAKNANPLALVAAAQQYPDPYYQAPKSHKSYAPPSKQSSSSRSNATTKLKGKEIAKPITPSSELASEEDSDLEQAQRDKDMQKNLALIAKHFKKIYKPTNNNLRTSSNSRNKNVDTSLRYKNDNQIRQFGNQRTMTVAGAKETEYRKPKRVKDYTYHKEKMLMCKQAEKVVPLQAKNADWLEDMDEEIEE
ncbi:hypothetical protein Tco_0134237 [Tanacetum coccineum]